MGAGKRKKRRRRRNNQGRRERRGGDRSRDRERERNRKHVRQRGRGELYTDTERWDCVERDQEFSMGKRCKENKTGSKSMFTELGRKLTRNSRKVHGQKTGNL